MILASLSSAVSRALGVHKPFTVRMVSAMRFTDTRPRERSGCVVLSDLPRKSERQNAVLIFWGACVDILPPAGIPLGDDLISWTVMRINRKRAGPFYLLVNVKSFTY